MIEAIIYSGDIEALRPIAQCWYGTTYVNRFRINIDVDTHLSDLKRLIDSPDSDLLVLMDNDNAVGYMGVQAFTSPLGRQKITNEHYWYVLAGSRGIGSMRLIKLAQRWAKDKGCSHLIMNASNLASDLHDRICGLYEQIGMTKFETSYILPLEV